MNIKPSLYIGLGGTGIKAISQTKKMFEDKFGKGNIPECIAFIAIDNDSMSYLATSMKDDFVDITPANPKVLYEVYARDGKFDWMFDANARYISSHICNGASQVRTTGRFYFEINQNNIRVRLRRCFFQISNAVNNPIYNVYSLYIDVHIVTSLAGGIGAGSFLNMAQLVRDELGNNVNIMGYGVLHGVFKEMDPSGLQTPRVVANAYASILDLDYLMSASPGNPIEITFNARNQTLTRPIYDKFYVIDNETEFRERIIHLSELCEAVGACLFVASGDLGSLAFNINDCHLWTRSSNYNISSKYGWVQSFGGCQVVYKGKDLAEIYSLKAALSLIKNLQTASIDIDSNNESIEWAKFVQIKEDDCDNQLIDSIYNLQQLNVPSVSLYIEDSISQINTTIDNYLHFSPKFLDVEYIIKRKRDLCESLKAKVNTILKCENGVGNAKIFLESLRRNVVLYRSQMDTECAKKFEPNIIQGECKLIKDLKEYEEYIKRIFRRQSVMRKMLEDDIGKLVRDILINHIEVYRRRVASEIFTDLLAEIGAISNNIDSLMEELTSLNQQYEDKVREIQIYYKSARIFEYDLSLSERSSIKFTPDENFVSDYLATLENGLYGVVLGNIDLNNSILSYCSILPGTNAYREKLLVDVIDELDNSEYEKLKFYIERKSSRLLCLNDKGLLMDNGFSTPTTTMSQWCLAAVYQREDQNNRLLNDRHFLQNLSFDYVETESEFLKQRMIFYRSDMSIIPYCIDAFKDAIVDREYTQLIRYANTQGSIAYNPHIDKQLFEQMCAINFKLKP